MNVSEALTIIADFAQGIEPISGHTLPDDSPYRHPEVLEALSLAAAALEKLEQREERERALPKQAGKPWNPAEDAQLCASFDAGVPIRRLAALHGRTKGAIGSRLARLGKLVPA